MGNFSAIKIGIIKKVNRIIILTLFIPLTSFAQHSEKEAVKSTINTLFAAMKAGDSTSARLVFHPKAILQSIGYSDKTQNNYLKAEARLDGFLKAIGTPHADVWDEKPGKYEIKIDNQMAAVWVPYQFYLGGKFSHCGIDNFTLFNENWNKAGQPSNWKIIYLVDTVRKENCVK